MAPICITCESFVSAALGHAATMMVQLFHRKTLPDDNKEDTFEYHRDKLSDWLQAVRGQLPYQTTWVAHVSFCFSLHVPPTDDHDRKDVRLWAFPVAKEVDTSEFIFPVNTLLLRFCKDHVVVEDVAHPEARIPRVRDLRRCTVSERVIQKDRNRRARQKPTAVNRILTRVAQAALPCVPILPRRTYTMAIAAHVNEAAHRFDMHEIAAAFAEAIVVVESPEGNMAIGMPC
jgi:hypothetical protein